MTSGSQRPFGQRIIGIDFTDGIIDRLRMRGFTLTEVLPDILSSTSGLFHGFKAYFASMEDPSHEFGGFEIQIVTDEVQYLKYQKRDHFFPFIKVLPDKPDLPAAGPHVNTCYGLEKVLTSLDGLSPELARYLGLKKNFPMSCVVLRRRDFDEFCRRAKPDEFFQYGKHRAALLHLGPSCFDFLVYQPDESAV